MTGQLRVVGAGLGRTGTHTLKVVLERLLDGPCHHMVELFAHPEQVPMWAAGKWEHALEGYVSMVDWPGAAYWREIAEANPDALVLLSVRRDADEWYRSASQTIFPAMEKVPDGDPWGDAIKALVRDHIGQDWHDAEATKAAYDRHNAEVRATIPSSRLLEWRATDGWAPLCEALGVDVPDEPFPVTNTTEEFNSRGA